MASAVPPLITSDSIFSTLNVENLYTNRNIIGSYSNWKLTVDLATTDNIALQGLQVIDGIQTVNNNRILVKNQTNAVENGIYVCNYLNWKRAQDLPIGSTTTGFITYVRNGTVNINLLWYCTIDGIVGTDSLSFRSLNNSIANTEFTNSILNSILIKTDNGFTGYDSLLYTEDFNNAILSIGKSENTNSTIKVFSDLSITSGTDTGLNIITGGDGSTKKSGDITFQTGVPYNFAKQTWPQLPSVMISDSNDNIYVAGTYTAYNFDIINTDGSISNLKLPKFSDNSQRSFIIKYTDGKAVSFAIIDTVVNKICDICCYQNQIYLLGRYTSSIPAKVYNFGNNTSDLTYNFSMPITSGLDLFLVKWSSSGNATLWTSVAITSGTDIKHNIITNSLGDIYVQGYCTNASPVPVYNLSDNNTLGPATQFSILGNNGVYIIKWLNSGVANSWTFIILDSSDSYVNEYSDKLLAIDSDNNVYSSRCYDTNSTIAVYNFSGTNTLNVSPFSISASGGYIRSYVIKWSTTGTSLLWTVIGTNAGYVYCPVHSISIDSQDILNVAVNYESNNPLAVYNLSSNNTIGPGFQFVMPATGGDGYGGIIKWSNTGTALKWSVVLANYVEIYSMTIDNSDNLYITGNINSRNITGYAYDFSSTNAYGNVSSFSIPISSTNYYYFYSIKWDSDSLVKTYTQCNSNHGSYGYNCISDSSGNIYFLIATYYQSGLYYNRTSLLYDFSSSTVVDPVSSMNVDNLTSNSGYFIVMWDSDGTLDVQKGIDGNGASISLHPKNYYPFYFVLFGKISVTSDNIILKTSECYGSNTSNITLSGLPYETFSQIISLKNTGYSDVNFHRNRISLVSGSVTTAQLNTSVTLNATQGYIHVTNPSNVVGNSFGTITVNNSIYTTAYAVKANIAKFNSNDIAVVNLTGGSNGQFILRVMNRSNTPFTNTEMIIGFILF